MIKLLNFKYLVIAFGLLSAKQAAAQSIHGPLLDGDVAYDKKEYGKAENAYRNAADRDNGNPQAIYNLANALFQQGKFEDAGERYKQAIINSKNKNQQADALHNFGDAMMKQHRYKEAVQSYEQSLRLRPGDAGTRENLQMAKKKVKEEEAQEKQKQQQQQQNQNQQNDQQNQQQDKSQQNQQNQQNQQQQQQNQQNQQDQSQQQKKQQQQQQPKTEQQLRKEEAKRLLETAIGTEDRKNARKYRTAQQESKPRNSDKKDW